MVVRFRNKVRRMRGSRTHGWGSKKKHRGGGSKGGKGMSGLMKHKKSWMIKYDPQHFGRVGFKLPQPLAMKRQSLKAITLKDLDRLAKRTHVKEIDVSKLGFYKVLSTGKLTEPLTIKAKRFAERAKEKIEEIGGKAIQL